MNESSNRAFMYGESVFTTMKMVDGIVRDWDLHFERLRKGAEFLYGPFTDGEEWPVHFRNRLEAKFEHETGNKIIRLTLYRQQERGLQRHGLISVFDLKAHLQISHLDANRLGGSKLKLRTCPAVPRPLWWPSFLKAGNYLETILSQKRYLQPEDDDLLFLSRDDTVLESSVANIFIIRHNKIYTAPPGPNVLEGIMRRRVLEVAKEFYEDCQESETTMEQLLKADGVFGTNSVRGLFLIDRIDDYEIRYEQDVLNRFEMLKDRLEK